MTMNMDLKSEPLVSFLVATYNRAKLAQQCISSILSQTYSNIEVIVVDDASTDDTERIINSEFAGKIKYHKNEKNRGVAYSRNLGLSHATGKYIGLLDSDDILLEPNYLRIAVKILESNPEVCVFTSDVYCINREGKRIYEKTFFQMTVDHRGIELSSGIKDFDYVFCHGIHSCGAIFRKDITEELGFLNTDYKIAWDEDFFLRVAASGKFKIYYHNSPMVAYRIHNDNLSNNLTNLYIEKIKARIDILKHNRNLKRQFGIKFKRRLANQYYCLIDAYIKEKKTFSAMFTALKAIIIYPPIFLTLAAKFFTLPIKNLVRNY